MDLGIVFKNSENIWINCEVIQKINQNKGVVKINVLINIENLTKPKNIIIELKAWMQKDKGKIIVLYLKAIWIWIENCILLALKIKDKGWFSWTLKSFWINRRIKLQLKIINIKMYTNRG